MKIIYFCYIHIISHDAGDENLNHRHNVGVGMDPQRSVHQTSITMIACQFVVLISIELNLNQIILRVTGTKCIRLKTIDLRDNESKQTCKFLQVKWLLRACNTLNSSYPLLAVSQDRISIEAHDKTCFYYCEMWSSIKHSKAAGWGVTSEITCFQKEEMVLDKWLHFFTICIWLYFIKTK